LVAWLVQECNQARLNAEVPPSIERFSVAKVMDIFETNKDFSIYFSYIRVIG
jgi:hypothetical protein